VQNRSTLQLIYQQLATVAYVGLPECILALAIVTTLSHIRTWVYNRNDKRALTWSILYGLPTAIFLVLSLITIGCSMVKVDFNLPSYMVVARGLAGYSYGLIALLYSQLGVPQERDRLQQKDAMMAELNRQYAINLAESNQQHESMLANVRREKEELTAKRHQDNALLTAKIDGQTSEIEQLKALLVEYKNTERELINAVHKSSEDALQAYSEECLNWLRSGTKTVSLEEITRYTGHSKRKIEGAITKGYLQTASRNKELILVSSLVTWLKSVQPSTGKTEETPMLHIVNE